MNGSTDSGTYIMNSYMPVGAACASSILNKPFVMWTNAALNGGYSMEVYFTYAYTKIL